ncbi:MAG: PEP-CTERM sorting domain-containing protein [Chthonomonas sp.]|nr:PEP-CTERM sorting domain-containing protein [Chthonomonas sp.]
MKYQNKGIATALAAATLLTVAVAKMPPNSYLISTANSVGEIVAQIDKYPVVQDRYERHFGMTKSELKLYFSSLRLSRVERSGNYLVYNTPESTGELRSKTLFLKKGTKIWVNTSGKPILQWICGNPMTRGPRTVASVGDVAPVAATIEGMNIEPEVLDAPKIENIETDTIAMEPNVPEWTDAPLTSVDIANIPVDPVQAPAMSVPNTPAIASSGWDLGRALLAPLGGGLIFVTGTKSQGSSKPIVNPVPEPATFVAMGMGAAYLIRRKKSSFKR